MYIQIDLYTVNIQWRDYVYKSYTVPVHVDVQYVLCKYTCMLHWQCTQETENTETEN